MIADRVLEPTETPTSPRPAMALLGEGVPLSLLLDLAGALDSREIYQRERADVAWVPSVAACG